MRGAVASSIFEWCFENSCPQSWEPIWIDWDLQCLRWFAGALLRWFAGALVALIESSAWRGVGAPFWLHFGSPGLPKWLLLGVILGALEPLWGRFGQVRKISSSDRLAPLHFDDFWAHFGHPAGSENCHFLVPFSWCVFRLVFWRFYDGFELVLASFSEYYLALVWKTRKWWNMHPV